MLAAAPFAAATLLDNPAAVLGTKHDLSVSGSGAVTSAQPDACIFCHGTHLPERGGQAEAPLWNRELPIQTYSTYTSSTYDAGAANFSEGSSKLCLSCHDGTIAPGRTLSRGPIPTRGSLGPRALTGTDLTGDHPVGIEPVDDGQLIPSLFGSPPKTAEPEVRLFAGRIECTSCHAPHEPALDPIAERFLVRSNRNGALCLACHDPNRPQPNRLNGWNLSAHASAANTVPTGAAVGPYGSVDADACLACHRPHHAGGAVVPRLLRAAEESACESCHRGAGVSPPAPDVMRDFSKAYAHPTIVLAGLHDPIEDAFPLEDNRHAECVDCHEPHATQSGTGTTTPPAVMPALTGASGFDGLSRRLPATSEYEVCFKCHADSRDKPQTALGYNAYGYTPQREAEQRAPDPKNLREKLASNFARHNVSQPRRLSDAEVPSLRTFILYPNGAQGRSLAMGSYLYCSDCHASEAAARARGKESRGPHGSIYSHILTARYEQEFPVSTPGITAPQGISHVPGPGGSYALCNLCHDVDNNLLQNHSFSQHRKHVVEERTSCSTCHDAHGVSEPGGNAVNNYRMISFDLSIVSPDRMGRLYLDSSARECYLSCHGVEHSPKPY